MNQRPSLPERLTAYLQEPKTLQACYGAFAGRSAESIRARIYERLGTAFRRITKGVYLATNGDTQALILEGDAWNRITEISPRPLISSLRTRRTRRPGSGQRSERRGRRPANSRTNSGTWTQDSTLNSPVSSR